MKKILLISYLYPPTLSSQSEHVKNLGNYLSDYYDVSILTTNWDYKKDYVNSNKKITVYSTPFGFLHRVKINNDNGQKIKRKKGVKSKIVAYLKGRMIPDSTFDWYFVAMNWLKNNVGKYDVIISIATPYTDLLIGNKFYKMHKDKDKPTFITCYADPWYGEISRKRSYVRTYIEKHIENSIMMNADNILMVTKNAKAYYSNIFPQYNNKMYYYYIGHNVDVNKYLPLNEGSLITFRYFGALQSIHRNPFVFLEALENKEYIGKISLEFYLIPDISHEEIYKRVNKSDILKDIVKFKETVPYENMLQIASSKGINILFGNTSSLQIPVKMFDYIGVKSEILYIENTFNDEISQILYKYNACSMCKNNFDSINDTIEKILYNHDNKLEKKPSDQVYMSTSSNVNFNIYRQIIGD